MAKKQKSFSEKVAAATTDSGRVCPVCGELYQHVKRVTSVENGESGSWKFNQKMVNVCKCNRAEVMG